MVFPEFATPEQIAASQRVDAEIAAARDGMVQEIEPWNNRLARCLPAVQQMLEINSLLVANCGEEDGEEEEVMVEPFSADAEKEARIERYSLNVELNREIEFIAAAIRLV